MLVCLIWLEKEHSRKFGATVQRYESVFFGKWSRGEFRQFRVQPSSVTSVAGRPATVAALTARCWARGDMPSVTQMGRVVEAECWDTFVLVSLHTLPRLWVCPQ